MPWEHFSRSPYRRSECWSIGAEILAPERVKGCLSTDWVQLRPELRWPVVVISKFAEGAWITVVIIPAMLLLMYGVWRHYERVWREIASDTPLDLTGKKQPLVVIPIQQWNQITKNALCAALAISGDVLSLLISDPKTRQETSDDLCLGWMRNIVEPARRADVAIPELVVVLSPFRFVVNPIVDYVIKLSNQNPDRRVVVIVCELVEHRWYNYFLHSQRATILKALLLLKGNNRISALNIPWYVK